MLLSGLLNAPSAQVRHVCEHHRFTMFHANQGFDQGSADHQATVLRMLAIITHTSSCFALQLAHLLCAQLKLVPSIWGWQPTGAHQAMCVLKQRRIFPQGHAGQTLLPTTGFRAAASLCPCKASCSYCMCAHPSS